MLVEFRNQHKGSCRIDISAVLSDVDYAARGLLEAQPKVIELVAQLFVGLGEGHGLYQIGIPDEQHTRLDVRFIKKDVLGLVLPIVRQHLEFVLTLHLQTLDVLKALVREEVDSIANELFDADIDQ